MTGARPYGAKLDDKIDTAYRVIADHIRTLTFALTDGAQITNEGRGYVLRRILRRAARHGWQTLKMHEPFLYKLVPAVVDAMGEAFPELKKNPKHVVDLIREEEESFDRTLDRGIELFDDALVDGYCGVRMAIRGEMGVCRRKVGASSITASEEVRALLIDSDLVVDAESQQSECGHTHFEISLSEDGHRKYCKAIHSTNCSRRRLQTARHLRVPSRPDPGHGRGERRHRRRRRLREAHGAGPRTLPALAVAPTANVHERLVEIVQQNKLPAPSSSATRRRTGKAKPPAAASRRRRA